MQIEFNTNDSDGKKVLKISLEKIYKNSLNILFILILITAICLLLSNVCNYNNFTNNEVVYLRLIDTTNVNSLGVSTDTTSDNISIDGRIAYLVKPAFNYLENNDSTSLSILYKSDEIQNDILDQEQIIKIITLLFTVFAAIFGIFTFLTQNNLNRAEKIKEEFEHLVEHKSKDFFKQASSLADSIENYNIESKSDRELMFLISSQFFDKDQRPSSDLLQDIIDLWQIARVKFAAWNLRANGNTSCLLFLNDRYNFYISQDDNLSIEAANYIKDAIDEINKRDKEQE